MRQLEAGGSVVVIDLRRDLAVGLHGLLPRGPAHFRDYRAAALNLLDPELFPNLQWVSETLAGAFWGGNRSPAGPTQEMLGGLVRTLGWHNMRQVREGNRRKLLTASDLLRLVSDREFRETVVAGIADTGAAHWWESADRCGGLNQEVVAALQARLGILSANPVAAAAMGNGGGACWAKCGNWCGMAVWRR